MKLKRIISLVLLPFFFIVGSLYAAYASNYFFEDILNIEVLFGKNSTFLVTIPVLLLAASFVLLLFYLYRLALRPNTFKRHTLTYLGVNLGLNVIGFITSIVSAYVVYGTLLSIYPYPGHCILIMLAHLGLTIFDVIGIVLISIFVKKDEEKHKVNVGYVFATIGWFLFISLVMNRFGTFLMSPFFLSWKTFYMTFPFYIFLALPVLFLIYKLLFDLKVLRIKAVNIVLLVFISSVVSLFGFIVLIIGLFSPVFVSAVSVSMPLERLAAKPVEIPIHIIAYSIVTIVLLVEAIIMKKPKAKEEAKPIAE